MTLSPLNAQQGLTIAQGVAGFINDRTSAKLARSLQKYRNQMLEITAAMNARAISQNEIRARDATVRLAFQLEAASARDIGKANVSAAAAGVQGRSVDRQLRGLRGSLLNAHAARKEQVRQTMAGFANDRINNRVSAIMQTDITTHQKPSVMFALGGVAKGLFNNSLEAKTPSERKAIAGGSLLDFFT